MKSKLLWIFSSILLVIIIGLLILKPFEKEELTTRIGIIKVQSGLPTFVAYENDILKEFGFVPELVAFKTSDQTFDALKNGDIDIVGVSGIAQGLSLLDNNPNSFKIIGILNSSPCLIVKNESEIKEIEDLKGKTIGVYPGSIFGKYVKEALNSASVDISDITYIPLPPPLQLNELKNDGVDALFTLQPIGVHGVSTSSCRYISRENLFSKYLLNGNPFPGGVVAVSEAFSKNETAMKNLILAYEKSLTIISDSRFNPVPYLDKYTSIDPTVYNEIKYEGATFDRDSIIERTTLFGENINKWGLLNSKVDFSSLIYED